MTTVKISQLPAITGANTAATDVLPIVDVSGNITNKITREEFFKNIQSDVEIADKIVHSGDTNTAIRFPAADTVTVETSGTERLRVDSTGNVGIGTSVPSDYNASADNLVVGTTSGNNGITIAAGTANQGSLFFADGTANAAEEAAGYLLYVHSDDSMRVGTANTERMRITSAGNVGIGTTSPTADLSVGSITTSSGDVHLRTTKTAVELTPSNSDAGGMDFNVGWVAGGQGPLKFSLGSTERMRIDASGNLGLGVTPSAWQAGSAIQMAGGQGYSRFGVTNNSYYDGAAYRYVSTAAATLYGNSSGSHLWFNAPSGTAGNAITFTQAMTLDASGNLGIGSTAPVSYAGYSGATIQNANGGFINFRNGANTNQMEIAVEAGGTAYVAAVTSTPLIFKTNNTERARIDSSGNLLVGTTVQNGRVTIRGSAASSKPLGLDSNASYAEIQSYDNGPLYLNRQGNDVIVNATAGNLLVGTTARRIDERMVVVFNGGSGSGLNLDDALVSGTATAQRFYRNGAQVGTISTTASATAYNTSSDYRLKENVAPMQNALDTVSQLNPVTYTWKADGSAGQGFIAHELQAVVPDCVTGEKDAVDADGKPQYQGVDTSFLVATLVKAIQEQQTTIAALEARITALEA